MRLCPDCRNPMPSLMMIDGRLTPEHYCERCARTWPAALEPAPKPAPREVARV